MPLKESRGAIVRRVVPFTVHDQPHFQIHYSPAGEEHAVYQARIGNEGVYDGIAPGDQVIVHSMMNVVTRIERV